MEKCNNNWYNRDITDITEGFLFWDRENQLIIIGATLRELHYHKLGRR